MLDPAGIEQPARTEAVLAVTIRRLHDLDRSDWWSPITLVPLVSLVLHHWFVRKGTEGDDRFGPDPLEQCR